MMPIDASIPLNVRPVEIDNPMNALTRVLQAQALQQQSQMGQLKMDEYQRGVDRQNRLDQILMGGGGAKELRQGGFLKESLDVDKSAAETDAKRAETTKNKTEAALRKIGLYRDAVNGVNDPDAVRNYIQTMHADPDLQGTAITAVPLDQLLAQVPQDPAAFAEFKQRFVLGAEKFAADQRARQELALKGANEPFNVGTNGEPIPNQPVQDFQVKKAKSGASNVNVAVSTEKSYGGEFGKLIAQQDAAAIDGARSAPQRIQTAQQVMRLLDTQAPITGSGAETRLAISKALSTAGLIDGQSVKSTEDLASLLASQTLDAIRTSGLGSGQGFTDKDRQFLERAKSGNIEMNAGTLRTLAALNEKAARATLARGREVAARLQKNPELGFVTQGLQTEEPPAYLGPSVVRKPPTAGAGPTVDDLLKKYGGQ